MKTARRFKTVIGTNRPPGYPAYKGYKGRIPVWQICAVHETMCRAILSLRHQIKRQSAGKGAAFQRNCDKHKRIALQDYRTRNFWRQTEHYSYQAKGSEGGVISISRCGQEVLERTACKVDERKRGGDGLLIRGSFPANGNGLNARELIKILYDYLPPCVDKALCYPSLDPEKARRVMELSVDQAYIRSHLDEMGLVAFIANGSVLPGIRVSQRPMKGGIPFVSPSSMEVTLDLPNRGRITGMGIRKRGQH